MTYKNIKKIQVYILISLSCFIFTKNIQIIFKTRNISETYRPKLLGVIFLVKKTKNEVKANTSGLATDAKPTNGAFLQKNSEYIKGKHSESLSRARVLIDKLIFLSKGLINRSFYLLHRTYSSVEYRYLLGQKALEHKRSYSLKKLEELIGARGLPLVKGMLFGDLSGIDRETYHSFKVIGILHVLSASSANFTIFLHFCLFFIRPLTVFLTKRQLFCLHFLIIFAYFSLVGAVASTIRAFLTLSLAFYASFVLQRSFLPLSNLYLAAVFMLTINPFYLETLSFQFSFLASFGIIFLYNYLEKEPFIGKNYFFKNILLTFCAQFFLIPILIFNFSELNYLSILANFVVLPLVELLTIMFLASFIVLFLSGNFSIVFFERILYFLISETLDILYLIINFLEEMPFKNIIFNEDKSLFTAIFILINILSIFWIYHLKSKKYSKNKYRIFK